MIYLDHAATTPVAPEAVQAMVPYFSEHWGNPSSIHAVGRRARQGLDEARETVARVLGCRPKEVVFTSGGSEGDNLAIKGIAWAASAAGRHIITTAVEHRAVLGACGLLERTGFEVTYLPVDRYGRVDPAAVEDAITERTTLVSVGYANNEVGTIQPVTEVGAVARRHGVRFHTDAVQAGPFLPLDVDALNAHALTLAAHKLYGPKGIGALFVRSGTPILPQQHGGSQERQRRAGTENVPLAVGFAAALDLVQGDPDRRAAENARQAAFRDRLIAGLVSIPDVILTGDPRVRLPNSASVIVEGVDGADLVAALDLEGVAASTGSACTSGSTEPSHVLLAMGYEPTVARGSLRLTVGRGTTAEHVDRTLEIAERLIARLRGHVAGARAMAAALA